MGLSIAGIILVQIVWITNAIGVKNDLFDRSVNEALTQAVQRLEDRRNFRIFTQVDDKDSLVWVQKGVPPPPPRQFGQVRDNKFPRDYSDRQRRKLTTHIYIFG